MPTHESRLLARVGADAPTVPAEPSGPAIEAVLRELLDDSHARLREVARALESLKDDLTAQP